MHGFECFYPHLRVKPVNPRSRTTRPYFPGYMFLRADIAQVAISTFQWMPFSNGLLMFDGIPAAVPDSLVQGIRRHVEQINEGRAKVLEGLQPGEPLIIQGGPFEGYEAIFDARLPGRDRVRVLLKLLQARYMELELPGHQIRRAPPRRKPR